MLVWCMVFQRALMKPLKNDSVVWFWVWTHSLSCLLSLFWQKEYLATREQDLPAALCVQPSHRPRLPHLQAQRRDHGSWGGLPDHGCSRKHLLPTTSTMITTMYYVRCGYFGLLCWSTQLDGAYFPLQPRLLMPSIYVVTTPAVSSGGHHGSADQLVLWLGLASDLVRAQVHLPSSGQQGPREQCGTWIQLQVRWNVFTGWA